MAPADAVVRRSLRLSILDGAIWGVMQGAAANHINTLVALERSTLPYVAAVFSVPWLIAALTLLLSDRLPERVQRRKSILLPAVTLQALTWAPMAVSLFLPFDGVGYWLLLTSYVAFVALGTLSVPPWQSIMGDLVPPEMRGRYFGTRNMCVGATLMGSFFAAGWWITHCADTPSIVLLGLAGKQAAFLAIFALALGARLLSAWCLVNTHEPPHRPNVADPFTLRQFLKRAPRAHFGRFVLYVFGMQAGIGAQTPFMAWRLIDQGGCTAREFAAVATITFIFTFGSQPFWGRLSDKLGSKRVLSIGGVGLIAVPLLLIPCQSLEAFAAVAVLEGALTGAFNIACTNYLLDVVTPPKRAQCSAYMFMFLSLGLSVGAALAAVIGTGVPDRLGGDATSFTWMMVFSALLRIAANGGLLCTFAEFRLSRPRFGESEAPPER